LLTYFGEPGVEGLFISNRFVTAAASLSCEAADLQPLNPITTTSGRIIRAILIVLLP
jgi:hypothetical protein